MDRRRYLRVAGFFAAMFLSIMWWDVVLRRVPGARTAARRTALARWRRWARRFRVLAVQMGGVLIKLGQFLSIRVDVLPEAVTSELTGLQDEVPAERLEEVRSVVSRAFGRPVDEAYEWFAPEPEAAASLAQVHRARLPGGQDVVVKVQRPGIRQRVQTDLAAIQLAARWLKIYRPISRRVNLDRLFAEFAGTTQRELDFVAEGKNAERFAADFSDDSGICIARVYWNYTTSEVLTLENVASIKITDYPAIEAAGISRPEVASRLFDTYLKQIFVTNFVHADPHPGNLFVRPFPNGPDSGPGESQPFQLIFVDFGMVATIPEQLRASLRNYIIGIGTRDAHRVVQAYVEAGVLLPGADLKRLEALHDDMFRRMAGVRMGQLRDIAFDQAEYLLSEYRDILQEMPFQLPADILFVGRAVGILSGMSTSLDPGFEPWAAIVPFAEQLAADEMGGGWRKGLNEIGQLARLTLALPSRIDRLLRQAERGELVTQTQLTPDAMRLLRGVERAVERLGWFVVSAGLLIGGIILRTSEGSTLLNTGLLIAAGLALLWGMTRR